MGSFFLCKREDEWTVRGIFYWIYKNFSYLLDSNNSKIKDYNDEGRPWSCADAELRNCEDLDSR